MPKEPEKGKTNSKDVDHRGETSWSKFFFF